MNRDRLARRDVYSNNLGCAEQLRSILSEEVHIALFVTLTKNHDLNIHCCNWSLLQVAPLVGKVGAPHLVHKRAFSVLTPTPFPSSQEKKRKGGNALAMCLTGVLIMATFFTKREACGFFPDDAPSGLFVCAGGFLMSWLYLWYYSVHSSTPTGSRRRCDSIPSQSTCTGCSSYSRASLVWD